jgi:hypothetical protein
MKHIKLFENFSGEENTSKSYTLEVLPKFWQDLGIKRPTSSFGDEAGQTIALSRDNTVPLTLGGKRVTIYRRDARMYNDKGQKAGRGDDSKWYSIKIYKTTENNMLRYSVAFQHDKDAKLSDDMNVNVLGGGEFTSDEVGSMDTTKSLKIVAVK